jgi:CRP-like cAMP-binding protein
MHGRSCFSHACVLSVAVVLLSGSASMYASSDEHAVHIADLSRGDVFGELELSFHLPYVCTVVANTCCEWATFTRE